MPLTFEAMANLAGICENATAVVSGWEGADAVDASGGAFMRATEGKCEECRMEFDVEFSQPGYYRVYLRCQSTGTDDNDAYIFIDGASGVVDDDGTWREVDGIKTNYSAWDWESQAKHGSDTPPWAAGKPVHVEVDSAGVHRFAIGARSESFQIDKVVLILAGAPHDPPQGLGPDETTE